MYYRCVARGCGFAGEADTMPGRCPACGGPLRACREEDLTGENWTNMGLRALNQDKDAEKAYCYLQRAAMQGDLRGINTLGWCLETGTGVAADPRQAIWLYNEAREQGYLPACTNFARCKQYGIGTRVDLKEAVQGYRYSAMAGFAHAQYLLGLCYLYGNGVAADQKRAAVWFRRAAEQGDVGAMARWAGCLEFGWGIAAAPEQAALWYERAAAKGNVFAQRCTGLNYRFGECGVKINAKEAASWFRLAADQGDLFAAYNLGMMYLQGEIPGGAAQAQPWLEYAAQLLARGATPGEVAAQLGYCSGAYFSQKFHSATGNTPSAYRRMQQGLPARRQNKQQKDKEAPKTSIPEPDQKK